MFKISNKLARLAAVSSILAVLGTTMALPTAYAAGTIVGYPENKEISWCQDHGYQWVHETATLKWCDNDQNSKSPAPGNSAQFTYAIICSDEFPGSSFDSSSGACVLPS